MKTRPAGQAAILAALPATAPQLTAATGYMTNTVKSYLASLKRAGLLHVGSWVRHESGQPLAVYAAGKGEDARYRGAVVQESALSFALRAQPALARVWA